MAIASIREHNEDQKPHRKRKRKDKDVVSISEGKDLSKDERREAKRLRKEDRRIVNDNKSKEKPQQLPVDGASDTIAAKMVRKEERKLKKLEQSVTNGDEENVERGEKDTHGTQSKEAKKAEKVRLKAERKAKRKAQSQEHNALAEDNDLPEQETKLSAQAASLKSSKGAETHAPETLTNNGMEDSQGRTQKKAKGGNDASEEYVEDALLRVLPQSSIDDFLQSKHITVADPLATTRPLLRPITEFRYLPQFSILTRKDSPFDSFKSPTPIQAAAWPHLLSGRDVIGIAETGSGKTLAFGIPCVQAVSKLQSASKHTSPRAVIVAPTRELAVQSHAQLEILAAEYSLRTACIYGGMPKDQQLNALRKAHIIVATPGRLNDFIEEGSAKLNHVKYLILDEADRMLDTGFEDAIRRIISQCPSSSKGRQTSMFTATWPQSVRDLASTFMTSPIHITVSSSSQPSTDGQLHAPKHITQTIEVLDAYFKEGRLRELVKSHSPSNNLTRKTSDPRHNRILIFCLYKKEASRIEAMLRNKLAGAAVKTAAIHGDMSQPLRTANLNSFKTGAVSILVATDVAARGLDIPDVKVVVNFTFPLTIEDYVHRIGRTGRAGREGTAVTFFTVQEKGLAGALVNVLRDCEQEVPEELLKFGTTVKKKVNEQYGNFYREARPGEKKEGTMVRFD
ncbi:uncharacterized protein KY384_002387 [Bacidia gigantensis]|uniref:uncharacterized protein n=1 Tax=Bacidia gigantensis TaxID=2732470 RepID=UPI001D03C5C7|nr:uncharacterized protein KY384_002387 [Bacidia gigantensis]KAG8532510.1 hypothetical protein KY384_002387 [Bacidia gigantensis]